MYWLYTVYLQISRYLYFKIIIMFKEKIIKELSCFGGENFGEGFFSQ